MADVRYFVEVWPSDTSRDSKATIHLDTCPDTIKGRRQAREERNPNGIGWWGAWRSWPERDMQLRNRLTPPAKTAPFVTEQE